MLERDSSEMPLKMQAELLGLSYSSLFYQPVPPSLRELAIKRRIDEEYTAHPFYLRLTQTGCGFASRIGSFTTDRVVLHA